MRARRAVGGAAAAVLLGAPAAAAAEPVDLGTHAGVRFEAAGGTFTVADSGRYADVLEVHGSRAGMTLVNDVPMRTYLEGIAEVPARWPMEALKAQAVAARTYAWWVIATSSYPGYDICSTVACQVFHGRAPVEAPSGDRWARAVAETEGQVLTWRGAPILARYSSSSGGATRDNAHAFPGQGSYPYLRPVDDPFDRVSPWHRWEVRFGRDELDAILAEHPTFAPAVPVDGYEYLPTDGRQGDRVRLASRTGRVVVAPASDLRFAVSDIAPRLFPDRFPPRAGLRRLPATIPSSRFGFRVTADEVVVAGRGFGHGVGMSQWGAMGRAQAGHRHDDILAAYYGGLRPQRAPQLPERVRVGAVTGASTFAVTPERPMRVVVAGGTVVTDRALGTWTVRHRPDGTVSLTAPPGFGAPLVVSATTVSDPEPVEVEVVTLDATVSKPAELSIVVRDPAGSVVARRPAGRVDAPGPVSVTWDLDGDDGPLPPGRYTVALTGRDEDGAVAGTPAPIDIRPVAGAAGADSVLAARPPAPASAPAALPWLVVGGGVVVGAAGAWRATGGRSR